MRFSFSFGFSVGRIIVFVQLGKFIGTEMLSFPRFHSANGATNLWAVIFKPLSFHSKISLRVSLTLLKMAVGVGGQLK